MSPSPDATANREAERHGADAADDYPIYRGRDWLGRSSFVIHAGRRRLFFRDGASAVRAQARLRADGRLPRRGLFVRLLALGALLLALVAAMRLYPPLLLEAVDATRRVVGPAPVAYVETAAFAVGSWIRQLRVGLGDTAPRWVLAISPVPTPEPATGPPAAAVMPTPQPLASPTARPAPVASTMPEPSPSPKPIAPPPPRPTLAAPPDPLPATGIPAGVPAAPRAAWPPAPLPALIPDRQLPGEGQWQPLSALGDGGDPRMAVTVLRPDAARPDIQVAIVAVDVSRAELRMVAGTEEPPIVTGTVSYRPAQIPADAVERGTLLAAFNGGFKAVHGLDGMAANGEVYLPPAPERATIAVTRSGAVRLGLWGRDVRAGDDLLEWRQNGRLLVDAGEVTERARQGGLGWGTTVDLQAETWRSGIGLSGDGLTLLYAVGDGLTAARLAEILRAAGAWTALQLDINNYWVRFHTFQRAADGHVVGQPLISAMPREPRKYLVPDRRDFFYLVAR